MAPLIVIVGLTFLQGVVVAGGDKRLLLDEGANQAVIDRLDALSTRVDACELKLGYIHEPVAFKAHLSSDVSTPSANQRIIFDDVQLNIGNAYHEHLGGFLAPVNGTYLFSVSICSGPSHYIVLDLMRNGIMIGRILAGDDAYSDCSSETTVARLQAGDEVFLQHHGTSGDLLDTHENILNSFTGVLLQTF